MNHGARQARGKILLFLHADTILPPDFDQHILRILAQPGTVAGAFRLAIALPNCSLRFIEAGANFRATRWQMPYGDQAIFVSSRQFWQAGGFSEVPLLEDLLLIGALKAMGKIAIADQSVRTSGRRWQKYGTWRTTLRNQLILMAYFLGVSPLHLARWYRQGKH